MRTKSDNNRDDLRPEYDFDYSKAVRGKYSKRLIRHFSDGDNVAEIRQQRAKQAEADYLWAHCRTNNIGCETYRERRYDHLSVAAVNGKEYEKD